MKYIPVEVIEKQIALLRDLMSECGENDCITTAIKNLQIVNSFNNRVDEYDIKRKYELECLTEDAYNFVRDYIAYNRDVEPEDIDDDELDKYDYDFLVERYEHYADCNVAFNDTWRSVVADYMSDLEEDEGEESED